MTGMSDHGEREAASRELSQALRGLRLEAARVSCGTMLLMGDALDAADRARADVLRYREVLVRVQAVLGASTRETILENASVAFTLADNALKNQSGGDDGNQQGGNEHIDG